MPELPEEGGGQCRHELVKYSHSVSVIFNGGTRVTAQGMGVLVGCVRHKTGKMLGFKMKAWQCKHGNRK